MNNPAYRWFSAQSADVLRDRVYRLAGRILLEGCTPGRAGIVAALVQVFKDRAGPEHSDHDQHRYYRGLLPLVERLQTHAENFSRLELT